MDVEEADVAVVVDAELAAGRTVRSTAIATVSAGAAAAAATGRATAG